MHAGAQLYVVERPCRLYVLAFAGGMILYGTSLASKREEEGERERERHDTTQDNEEEEEERERERET